MSSPVLCINWGKTEIIIKQIVASEKKLQISKQCCYLIQLRLNSGSVMTFCLI